MSIQPFIKCSQIKTLLAFYTETLGFKVVQAPDPDPDSFMSVCTFSESVRDPDGNRITFGQRAA